MYLWLFVPIFFVWTCWPLILKLDPYLGDLFYRIKIEYRKIEGPSLSKRIWSLILSYFNALIPTPLLQKIDLILEMSGKRGKNRAVEEILLQLGILIGVILFSLYAQNTSTLVLWMFGILVCQKRWSGMLKKIKKRRIEASEAMRFLKRRYATLLRRKVPYEQALRLIAERAPGDFGVSFRKRLDETATRPLSEAMTDLAKEFRARELTSFVQVINVASEKTPKVLLYLIDAQIRDETARVDEFIDARKAAVQLKMRGFALAAFCFIMVGVGYVVVLFIKQWMSSGNGILGL